MKLRLTEHVGIIIFLLYKHDKQKKSGEISIFKQLQIFMSAMFNGVTTT